MKKTFKTLLALLMALALVAALFVPVWATEEPDPTETSEAAEDTAEAPEETTTEAPEETTTEAPEETTTEAPEETTTEAPAVSDGDETEAPTEAPTDAPTEAPTEAPEETTEAPEETTEAPEVDGIYAIIAYAEENGYVYVADVLTGFWAYFVPTVTTPYGPNWIWNTCYDGDVYGARHELGLLYFAECADVRWTIIDETNGGRLYNNYRASQHHDRVASIYWTGLDLDGKHPAGKWNDPTKVHFTLWIYVVDINGVEHPMFYSFDYYFIDNEGAPNCDACSPCANNGAAPAACNSDVPHTGL